MGFIIVALKEYNTETEDLHDFPLDAKAYTITL
jgi:hypothetical protein